MASFDTTSSQSWIYDVFISFRGEDTRKTFVDHLYTALTKHGIHTYKDDKTLRQGESIAPSLLKSIQESQVAIIVFSDNYADSSWCLDELAHIMRCKEQRGQIVYPIFYNLDPSDVRHQNQEFGRAFAKQRLKNPNRVASWEKALVDAANLSGWVSKHTANGHESELIKKIVKALSLRLHYLKTCVNENLVGMKTRIQNFESLLKIRSGGVRMVGIWGVGGGGKSTLAFSVFKEIFHQFDGYCFLENIRERSSKSTLPTLQENVLSDVLGEKNIVKSSEAGKHMIKSRLCHKSVLIVLDDVNHSEHLEALAGSHDWFGEGSRIVITTRDENLLNAHGVEVEEVCLLNNDEAIELFRRYARQGYRPVSNFDRLSLDVASYADGLPLVLKTFGGLLCDKEEREWVSALARLKEIPDAKIVEKLKISYDGLESHEKEIFLDIACLFMGEEVDSAMEILDACGFHPDIGVKTLQQKALVTISNGRFDMHDMVQEMGLHIVLGELPWDPEKQSRIWRNKDVLSICYGDTSMANEVTKALKIHYLVDTPPNLPQVVANMKKLRLLNVRQFGYKIVEGPEFLSNKLQWISWNGYPATSLPTTFHAKELVGLILHSSLLKQLWKDTKVLPSLKVLDLSYSQNLISTPDFSGLPCLERMILSGCSNLNEIHSSIGSSRRLVLLNMDHCSKLQMFPPIVHMENLKTLILSWCSQLSRFPDIQAHMDGLENLDLHESGIEVVPSSIGEFCTNLVSIDLSYCRHVKSIQGNFHHLGRLKKLHLQGCTRLGKLEKNLFNEKCCIKEVSLPPKSW